MSHSHVPSADGSACEPCDATATPPQYQDEWTPQANSAATQVPQESQSESTEQQTLAEPPEPAQYQQESWADFAKYATTVYICYNWTVPVVENM